MWNVTNEIVRITLIFSNGSPTLFIFSHPSQFFFFRACFLAFSPDRRLHGSDIDELLSLSLSLSLPGCYYFFLELFFVFRTRVGRHPGGMTLSLQRQPRRGGRFSTFRPAEPLLVVHVRQELQKRYLSMDRGHAGASERHSWTQMPLAPREIVSRSSR